MIIDFHTHYFPDKIAHDAIISLEQRTGIRAFAAGTRSSLEESMSKAGIDISLNLPVATSPDQVESINRYAEKNNRRPVFCLGAVHPLSNDLPSVISQVKSMGLRGVKMHPEYQEFSPDDESLNPLWEACITHSIFVVFHAGEDLAFKAPYRSSPAKFAELHRRFPEFRMVLAHFGSWRMWDAVERELIGLDVYLDTSFTCGYVGDAKLAELIRRHGADKVLFGTDSPWREQKEDVISINSLPLSSEEKELIFRRNAERLLGLE